MEEEMKNKIYNDMECPISRCLEHVGEWWSILIIRDVFRGLRRFDEFQKSLGISTNMLTRRLKELVETGILEKQNYGQSQNRFEYVLTEKGLGLSSVLITMAEWGNKYDTNNNSKSSIINIKTKEIAEPILIDKKTGLEITSENYEVVL
jgi:DNA-binding HxlR family transcriptional regulator